jgi:NitT/TauT family transport system ATP-binding protein
MLAIRRPREAHRSQVRSRSPASQIPSTVTSAPLLSLKAVSRRFVSSRHNTTAIDRVSLDVNPGEFVCIVGPSGCGKSTLLNIVAGLDHADAGEVVFDDKPIRRAGAERVVVFQDAALYPWLNVRANVEFGLKMNGVRRKQRRAIADRYLELVNLGKFERAFVHELSGGMKQRVQLARALAVEPRMLLMDEPFAALDAQTREVLQEELQEIWLRTGATILFVTHNVREAALLGDRVVVMTPSPGRIKMEIPVPLKRPRDLDTHAVVDVAAEIRRELQHDEYATRASDSSYVI